MPPISCTPNTSPYLPFPEQVLDSHSSVSLEMLSWKFSLLLSAAATNYFSSLHHSHLLQDALYLTLPGNLGLWLQCPFHAIYLVIWQPPVCLALLPLEWALHEGGEGVLATWCPQHQTWCLTYRGYTVHLIDWINEWMLSINSQPLQTLKNCRRDLTSTLKLLQRCGKGWRSKGPEPEKATLGSCRDAQWPHQAAFLWCFKNSSSKHLSMWKGVPPISHIPPSSTIRGIPSYFCNYFPCPPLEPLSEMSIHCIKLLNASSS